MGRLLSEILRQEYCVAAYIVSLRYSMKARLFQQRRCMMDESEKFCLWSRFAAVTQLECVDHRLKSVSDWLMFRTAGAASLGCFVVRESVMEALFFRLF